jgi:hypothetical protein
VGFAHRFRPTYAGANMGHPYGVVEPARGLRVRPAVSHISRKTSEMPRISCTQLWTGPRVRLSLRRGAGSSGNPRNSTGNRDVGHPVIRVGDRAKSGSPFIHNTEVFKRSLAVVATEITTTPKSISVTRTTVVTSGMPTAPIPTMPGRIAGAASLEKRLDCAFTQRRKFAIQCDDRCVHV